MIPNVTLMRDVFTEAAVAAKGKGLLLSVGGARDLFGEALHMIGVPEHFLADAMDGSYETISAIGAITVYLESGVLWDRGKKAEALQWARVWAARKTVGDIRTLLRAACIDTEEVTDAISR